MIETPYARPTSAPPAVTVEGVSKTFRLPHRQYSTLKERALHPLASRHYDELRAVRDVSFEVASGEFFGIVGRNGSGKSTLLKCLAGIYSLDGGRMEVRGRLSPFIELGVGFNAEMTARDNVIINAIMLGLSRREARARFDEIIEFAELEDFVDLKLKNYSSGMSVRLGFAVAIQVDADVLLVDEVLAVGDAAFQAKCFDEFQRLKDAGRTVLFVTHDMASVRRFCDRAMLVDHGEMIRIGDPESVSDAYGEINFGQIQRDGDASGAGVTNVLDAWCENAEGERALSVGLGEQCVACLEFETAVELENPVFALNFRNDARHTIFVATSEAVTKQTGTFAAGSRHVARFTFTNLLAASRYTLTASISDLTSGATLATREDASTTLFQSPLQTGGVALLPQTFEVTQT